MTEDLDRLVLAGETIRHHRVPRATYLRRILLRDDAGSPIVSEAWKVRRAVCGRETFVGDWRPAPGDSLTCHECEVAS